MRFRRLHGWNLPLSKARRLQERLAARVVERGPPGFSPKLVAGADLSHRRGSKWLYGAVVVLRVPGFEVVEIARARMRARFPYVPGFLSFREGPVLLACFRRLRTRPDAVLFDAQGRAHPRRFGLASHLGLWLGCPAVGCAKSILCGSHRELGARRGARAVLMERGERIGTALKTRAGSKPIYVSVGHRISLAQAAKLVLKCSDGRYRLPEPTRLAHIEVNAFRRFSEGPG